MNKLAEIVGEDSLVIFQKTDHYLQFINQEPPQEWLEDHPMASGVKYLPIGKVELLLTKIYQYWHVEVLREGQLLNSIYCTIRLHYKHPISGEWEYQDGVAAVPAKTDKGAKASDMAAIKSEAVMTGLPAAKSFAIKDAADHIGKIFGRDINRKGNLLFTPSYAKTEDEELIDKFKSAATPEEIQTLLTSLNAEQKRAYTPVAQNRLRELRDDS